MYLKHQQSQYGHFYSDNCSNAVKEYHLNILNLLGADEQVSSLV